MTVTGEVGEVGDDTAARLDALKASRSKAAPKVARRTLIRRWLHRHLTAKRGPFVVGHRWVSLVLVVWVVVESVTGASLVFEPQLTAWWNRGDIQVTSGDDIGMAEAARAASTELDGAPVTSIAAPDADGTEGMYRIVLAPLGDDVTTAMVDPGSGEVTTTDYAMPQLLRWAFAVHVRLNSTSILGFDGLTVTGAFAVAWLIVMLTGFYVWYWPGVKRWVHAVRVRRRRGRFTFHLDLHKAIGIVTWVPLVLVVVTGINFAFPKQVESVYRTVVLGTFDLPEEATPLSTVGTTPPIGPEEARRIVADLDPVVDVETVDTPAGSPVGVYTVVADVDPSFLEMVGNERTVTFAVDQYSGSIVSIEDNRLDGASVEAYESWSYPVHVGSFGGTTTKWLWVLLGLSPVVMGWTGVVMWLDRRSKRKAATVQEDAS